MKGTTHRRNLEEWFRAKGWSVTPLVIDSPAEAAQAFFAGRCRAYSSDAAQLAAMRLHAPNDPAGFRHPARAYLQGAAQSRRLGR
ncbi:MAG: hypothetical protein MZV49_06665 [Rhodopseudomonas palustris]|nr:hypothetical protein [Rhodopseudomonas palustris]